MQAAVSMFKQEYNEEKMDLSDALKLAIKVLNKTLDVTKLTTEKGMFTSVYIQLRCIYHSFAMAATALETYVSRF